jgi:hypothetical protein
MSTRESEKVTGLLEHELMFHEGVLCVEMPCCGFTFDAEHSDDRSDPSTWSCPLCRLDAR